MAASRPAQTRAENLRPLSDDEKAAIFEAIRHGDQSTLSRLAEQSSKFTPITSSPLRLTRIPTEARTRLTNARRSNAPPLSIGGPPQPRSVMGLLRAGMNGITDSLPLEMGNYVSAAINAVAHGDVLDDPITAYQDGLENMRDNDRFDEEYYPLERTAGKVVGTGAQVALLGPTLLGAARTARLAKASPLALREIAILGGVGGTGGAAFQVGSDIIGGRPVTAANVAGAAIGGGVGALTALTSNPGTVGATTGAFTSFAQDILNGRINSVRNGIAAVDRAADAASEGNALAVLPGVAVARFLRRAPGGTAPISRFTKMSKGELGEKLSVLRTWARGGRTLPSNGERLQLSDGYTIPDTWTTRPGSGYVEEVIESKFGGGKLKPRQNEAHRELANYRVDHFVPNDLGAALEFPVGLGVYQTHEQDIRRRK